MKKYLILIAACTCAIAAQAQETDYTPHIHGTVRAKWEYQPEENLNRFEMRNARVSIDGQLLPVVSYKAEIDLSDEGAIKMLDAYTRLKLGRAASFTIGQMRVPFTIDAHRSPHQQYFANRSFIAKQAGNVRDVGLTLACRFRAGFPVTLEGGLYNGKATLTDQKSQWHTGVSYSAKATLQPLPALRAVLSTQSIKPSACRIWLQDAGLSYDDGRLHIEGEYLYKHYADGIFKDVHAVDAFVSYAIPAKGLLHRIALLGRYDYMSDHYDGKSETVAITDYQRSRVTGGVTLSLAKPFVSDIRINYEKYFYREGAAPNLGEQDKFVIEFMTRF